MWTGSIAAFVVFVIVTQILLGGDRGFQSSGEEGFKILYPEDLPLNGAHFFVDTTKNPTNILFFGVVDVENRIESSVIALEIPYRGVLKENSGWSWSPLRDSTLVTKEFRCSEEHPCRFTEDIQYFVFEPTEPIDQKQSFRHSVRLWFSEENLLLNQETPPLIRDLNRHRTPYNIGFNLIEDSRATIVLDKSTDSFESTPNAPIVPGPRENTIQLDWDLQGGVLHQIDFQIPSERNFESQIVYYTALFGIGLGITSLALYGAEKRHMKIKLDEENKTMKDHFSKDAIDDSYHSFTENEKQVNIYRNNGQLSKIAIIMIILVMVGIGIAVGGYFAFFYSTNNINQTLKIEETCKNDLECNFPKPETPIVNTNYSEKGKEKIKVLEQMVREPIIQNALKDSNEMAHEMSEDIRNQIYLLREKEWTRSQQNTPFMESNINNDVSEFLREHHLVDSSVYNLVFGEHILTNIYGANVAVSVKTDNYLQSNDVWWQIASNDRKIKNFARDCEFDSSAKMFSEDIVLKINDENGDLLGILNSATPCNVLISDRIEEKISEQDTSIDDQIPSVEIMPDYSEQILPVPLDNITPIGNFKINYLKKLVNHTTLQNAILKSNQEFASFDDTDLMRLHQETDWPSPQEGNHTDFQISVIENEIAEFLRESVTVQSEEFGEIQFPEIILTNSKGVTIASSKLTFNYIHKYDDWWKVASKNDILVRQCGLDSSIGMSSEDIIIKIYNSENKFVGILNAATQCDVILQKPIFFYGDSN